MLNILLPAYSRSYAALNRTGLITATDETENQDLENLVLRERAVVWADQEESGHSLKSEKTVEERQETGSTGLELAPVLSFSQLLYHSNSPCSKFSYNHLFLICVFGVLASIPEVIQQEAGDHVTCQSQMESKLLKLYNKLRLSLNTFNVSTSYLYKRRSIINKLFYE